MEAWKLIESSIFDLGVRKLTLALLKFILLDRENMSFTTLINGLE